MSENEAYNLQRFVAAQKPVFDQVCSELRRGRKTSHWMWFIFPQIKGLGRSPMAENYAIASLAEAQAYLQHPILGSRLKSCTQLVVDVPERSAFEIFGTPDDLKFCSSMTLFAHATPDNEIFLQALRKYFAGGFDPLTLQRL